jgi:hypothetical protein
MGRKEQNDWQGGIDGATALRVCIRQSPAKKGSKIIKKKHQIKK